MKSKEQKRLEADYRAARGRIRAARSRIDRLGKDSPEWKQSLVQGIEVDQQAMTKLDTTLRSKGYWYNGEAEEASRKEES